MPKEQRPKKAFVVSFRTTEAKGAALERAARDSDLDLADMQREVCDAIIRAHQRSGRVPKDMEIQQRYYPSSGDELDWAAAEAPPGETINSVMRQAPRTAAAYFAGRLSGEIRVHPHFVHERSRQAFLACLRDALHDELNQLATVEGRASKRFRGAKPDDRSHPLSHDAPGGAGTLSA